jgi:hypothetical protein
MSVEENMGIQIGSFYNGKEFEEMEKEELIEVIRVEGREIDRLNKLIYEIKSNLFKIIRA